MTRTLFQALLLLASTASLHAQDADGTRIRLGQDTIVAGVRCAPTGRAYAVVYPNGKLDECPIAMDTVIAGHRFPRTTWIRLTEEGVLKAVWLPKPQAVQGIPCKGTGFKGWAVTFHPNGALKLCYLSELTIIDGIPCASASFLKELTGNSVVALGEGGELRSCRLARDFERKGVRYSKGNRISI